MEDTVEYHIFPILPDGLKQTECVQYLEEQADIYLAHLSRTLVEYIWQNEPFRLRVVAASETCEAHLSGRTNYGDNVEDEWFIVYLLYQLTKSFDGLVAKVEDGDGDFLLVEAANSLPRWLKPETATNRVFIYGGQLHIIPQPNTPAEMTALPSGEPQLDAAVQCVRDRVDMTVADSRIQGDIQRRITGFPEKMQEFFHRAHCYLPAHLAAILEQSPHLLAPIVHAFYHRDPVDLRACVIFQHFRPGTRVLREVKFTKCLYAQLVQQKFQPDRRSGYTLPPSNAPSHKAHSLGMKLAHGAEILCSKCGSNTQPGDLEQRSKNDARWHRFVDSLKEKGYFRGELEGSRLYQKLMDESRTYFYGTVAADDSDSIGERILALLKTVSVDIEAMKSDEKKLQPPDDDSWLDLSPELLDDMLRKMSGQQPEQPAAFSSSVMAEAVSKFVEKTSSFEGAEFPSETPESDIHLDPGSFMQNMQKMFEFSDSGSSSSDMSEYESDGDMEDSLSPSSPHKRLVDLADTPLQLQEYMDLMDRQLAQTTIGESFVRQPPQSAASRDKSAPKPPPRRKKLAKKAAAAAATQTSDTKQTSDTTKTKAPLADDVEDIDDIDDDFKPVNVDLNVVQNLLESYNAQQGQAGPASNILGSMGVSLPTPHDDL